MNLHWDVSSRPSRCRDLGVNVDQSQYRAVIEGLLEDSPITSPGVIGDIRELLVVGEQGLAFNNLCSWIYEDSLSIDASYYARLAEIAEDMDSAELVERLRELIV